MARKKKASVRPEPGAERRVPRGVAWLVLAGAWAFVLLSVLAFDKADPPSHTVWPANDPVRNLCGPVGAFIAYHLLKLVGVAVWVLLALWAGGLWIAARGRSFTLPGLRLAGVAMLLAACCGLVQLIWPNAGAMPQLSGGIVGVVSAGELASRFGAVGAALALLIAAAIGAVVAYDELLSIIPRLIGEKLAPAAKRAGGAATQSAASATTKTSGSLIGALGAMLKGRKTVTVRVNDLDDTVEVPANAVTRPERAPLAEPKPVVKKKVKPVVAEEPDVEEEAPGAPQVFDQDSLKEKIAKLPVRFQPGRQEERDRGRPARSSERRRAGGVTGSPGSTCSRTPRRTSARSSRSWFAVRPRRSRRRCSSTRSTARWSGSRQVR